MSRDNRNPQSGRILPSQHDTNDLTPTITGEWIMAEHAAAIFEWLFERLVAILDDAELTQSNTTTTPQIEA